MRRVFDLVAGALLVLPLASLSAATFTVASRSDSGPGSLRQALNDANTHAGRDEIVFTIPASSVIELTKPLPLVFDPVAINGVPGGDSGSRIRIAGPGFGDLALAIEADDVTVTDLELTGFFRGVEIRRSRNARFTNCSIPSLTINGGGMHTFSNVVTQFASNLDLFVIGSDDNTFDQVRVRTAMLVRGSRNVFRACSLARVDISGDDNRFQDLVTLDGVTIRGERNSIDASTFEGNGQIHVLGGTLTTFLPSTYQNTTQPIDLEPGANSGQNGPVIEGGFFDVSRLTLHGRLRSTANQLLTIHLFAVRERALTFIGSVDVVTDPSGLALFTATAANDFPGTQDIDVGAMVVRPLSSEMSPLVSISAIDAATPAPDLTIENVATDSFAEEAGTLHHTFAVRNRKSAGVYAAVLMTTQSNAQPLATFGEDVQCDREQACTFSLLPGETKRITRVFRVTGRAGASVSVTATVRIRGNFGPSSDALDDNTAVFATPIVPAAAPAKRRGR